jgi:hypothetical protein
LWLPPNSSCRMESRWSPRTATKTKDCPQFKGMGSRECYGYLICGPRSLKFHNQRTTNSSFFLGKIRIRELVISGTSRTCMKEWQPTAGWKCSFLKFSKEIEDHGYIAKTQILNFFHPCWISEYIYWGWEPESICSIF